MTQHGKTLRIAVWHNLRSGGGKRALYQQVQGLADRGHLLESWCPPTVDQSYLPLSDLVPEHVIPLDWEEPEGSTWTGDVLIPYRAMTSKIVAMNEHCRRCATEISRGNFDVLFANSCILFRVTAIGRMVKLPRLIYLPEPYRWLYESLPALPWLALPEIEHSMYSAWFWKRFARDFFRVQALRIQAREENQNIRAFNRVLANSLFSRESMLRAYGVEAYVCRLGIDASLFRPNTIERKKFVIGIGSVTPEKGIEVALKAIAGIPKEARPEFLWIGNMASDPHLKQIRSIAESLDVRLEVRIGISDGELVSMLGQASLMIYTPRLEPLGLAPLEATACETPVVAVAEGGVRETIQDGVNGILVPDARPQPLGNAIRKLLDNPALARTLGERGRNIVLEHCTWDKAVDELEQHLFEVQVAGGL